MMIWHDAKKELPTRSLYPWECVICNSVDKHGATVMGFSYSSEHKLFNALDWQAKDEAQAHAVNVDYWAYTADLIRGIDDVHL